MGDSRMKLYNKFLELIADYLNTKNNLEKTENFCNSFMDMFYTLSDKLCVEVNQQTFEILDAINLICDSYEKDAEIRKIDQYCLGEDEVKEKVFNYYMQLASFSSYGNG